MRIYNLFPRLAGPVSQWEPHLARAADLGFNAVFINPCKNRATPEASIRWWIISN
jgi:starch synthase (maltosyl-transferring)